MFKRFSLKMPLKPYNCQIQRLLCDEEIDYKTVTIAEGITKNRLGLLFPIYYYIKNNVVFLSGRLSNKNIINYPKLVGLQLIMIKLPM